MKKLILMYPNQRWHKNDSITTWTLYPVTLCILAAMVKDIAEVHVVDAQLKDMSKDEFKEKLREIQPDYVGISVLASEYQNTLDITLNLVKEVNPNITTIAGGVHVTTKYDTAFKNKNLDFGVKGEGEYVLKELLLHLDGKGELPTVGLVYRDKTNKLIVQNTSLVEDLSSLPWPDYSYVNLEDYIKSEGRLGPNRAPEYPAYSLSTTRGCPFGCSFCQVEVIAGKSVRYRDEKDVVAEILSLKEKYKIKSIVFGDDNLLMADGGRYAARLFQEMIDKKVNLKWVGIAFALFLMTDKLLDLMKKSGCAGINIAIESGSQRVLKQIIKKPIKDINKVPKIIEKIHKRDMFVIANFIIGLPSETWEEIRQTIKFAEDCGADYVKFFPAVPLKGTELYDIALETDSVIHDEDSLTTDWGISQIKSNEWSPQDINILRFYEWDRINFQPHKIKKTAELWGVSIEEMNDIRLKSRENFKPS